MNEHIVRGFTDELQRLAADILRMGGIAEKMVTDACTAVARGDAVLGAAVVEADADVDALEASIERHITRLLALRQPLARDLRETLAALKISHDLERIGDLAKNTAKRAGGLPPNASSGVLDGVDRMGKAVAAQLRAVLDAYAARNVEDAVRVWLDDEDVDQHYNVYFREIVEFMTSNAEAVPIGAHILFMAKNLERIGDHCTNIAELVHYLVTGEQLSSAERPKIQEIEV